MHKVLDFIVFWWIYWLTQSYNSYEKYSKEYGQLYIVDLSCSDMTSILIHVLKKLSSLIWCGTYKII